MCQVSIITASFNYAQYLQEAILSVQAQTFTDWELIIVDDGSQDDSLEIIQRFLPKDSRIKLYTHENHANKGLRETLKLGISHARGKYIAFLESDDCWQPENLARKVMILERYPDVGIIDDEVELFGNNHLFSRYDQYWSLRSRKINSKQFPTKVFADFFVENLIPTFSCAVCRADAIRNCNWDYFYTPHIDRSLWLQICKKYSFYHLPEKLTRWRIHEASYISSEKQAYREHIFRKVWALLAPCYRFHWINVNFYFAVIRFVIVNFVRSIKNRLGIKQ